VNALVVATPTFDPPAGAYSSPQSVAISCATPGATIFYTTDGSIPTITSTRYSAPVLVSVSETIQAIAVIFPPEPPSGFAVS
jgi:chitinase